MYKYLDYSFSNPLLHPLECCMNALASEKSPLKAIKLCVEKVFFWRIDLDTARSLYMKILCVRTRPLTFFVRQGKAPPEIIENLAGSHRSPQKPAIYSQSYTTSGLNPSGLAQEDHFWVGGLLLILAYDCTQGPGHRKLPQVTGGDRQWSYSKSATTCN